MAAVFLTGTVPRSLGRGWVIKEPAEPVADVQRLGPKKERPLPPAGSQGAVLPHIKNPGNQSLDPRIFPFPAGFGRLAGYHCFLRNGGFVDPVRGLFEDPVELVIGLVCEQAFRERPGEGGDEAVVLCQEAVGFFTGVAAG